MVNKHGPELAMLLASEAPEPTPRPQSFTRPSGSSKQATACARGRRRNRKLEGLIDLIPIFRHMPFLVTNGVDRHSQVVAKGV